MTRLALAALLVPTLAFADAPRDTPAAIELDRHAPPPGRTELGFDGGADVHGWGATVAVGWLAQPALLRSGGLESAPVERRQTLSLGAALALGPSVVVDARFPMAHQTGDRLRLLGVPRALDRWVPGDVRLGARIRVMKKAHVSTFLRGELTLPTGDDHDFAGEAAWAGAWSIIGRFTLPRNIIIAVNGGIRLRGAEVLLGDRVVANELFGNLGVVVPLPPVRPLWCDPDFFKLTGELAGILGDDVAGERGPSPVEARFGFVGRPLPELTLGVRAGFGLTDEIGAPRWRALLEVTYQGYHQVLPPRAPAEQAAEEPTDDDIEM
ncbi:MAG: hypothetical protein SFX73_27660 [Kofleriaceae bacterium]|nr:hypothetical protein [Kofleriaceae bacterium]